MIFYKELSYKNYIYFINICILFFLLISYEKYNTYNRNIICDKLCIKSLLLDFAYGITEQIVLSCVVLNSFFIIRIKLYHSII